MMMLSYLGIMKKVCTEALRGRQAIWRSGSFPGVQVDQWAGDESTATLI